MMHTDATMIAREAYNLCAGSSSESARLASDAFGPATTRVEGVILCVGGSSSK